jgi:hypothetical protein
MAESQHGFHVHQFGGNTQAVPVQVLSLILYPKDMIGQQIKGGMLETWKMQLLVQMVWPMYPLKICSSYSQENIPSLATQWLAIKPDNLRKGEKMKVQR